MFKLSGCKLLIFVYFDTQHLQILMFKQSFHHQELCFNQLIKQIKNDFSRYQQDKG